MLFQKYEAWYNKPTLQNLEINNMENNKLPHGAYGEVSGDLYRPLLKKNELSGEKTLTTIIIGLILAALFAGANTYLGLMSGLTVAAGIPGAILGSGLLTLFGKKSIAGTNTIQVMASGGESFSSGIIFVLPAVILLGSQVDFITGVAIGIIGVLLGASFTAFIRKYLVIESHGELLFPESTAVSETVLSANAGGFGLKMMFLGSLIGSFFVTISNQGIGLFKSTFSFHEKITTIISDKFKYLFVGEVNPALIGVGFIVGKDVGIVMMAGAILSGFILIPILSFFANSLDAFSSSIIPIAQMDSDLIFKYVIRYIGAGTIATGGLISVIRLLPVLISSIKGALSPTEKASREDISPLVAFSAMLGTFIVATFLALILGISIIYALLGGLLAIIMSLLFSIVAARLSGQVGTSNLPVSGMTIASLLVIASLMSWFMNMAHIDQKTTSILIIFFLSIVVTTIAISGGFAQSVKATYIIGGTTKTTERLHIAGSLAGVLVVIPIIMFLHGRILSGEAVAAQANLMTMLTTGIVTGKLPWIFICIGICIALFLYLVKMPVMSFAIGMYLPMSVSLCVLSGGLIRFFVERKYKQNAQQKENYVTKGIIISSGMIAGASIIGLLLAIISFIFPLPLIHIKYPLVIQSFISLVVFIILCLTIYLSITKGKEQ